MTDAAADDPHHVGHADRPARGRDLGGVAPKRIIVGYGFWLFLVSDIIMFAAFFAAHAVLQRAADGGPTGAELFHMPTLAAQTALLLLSTFACGLASLAIERRAMLWTELALLVTGLLGAGFLVLEINEFAAMIAEGAGPGRSAFLSSFFALVGLHGLHVTAGLLWCGTMMAQLFVKGFRADIERRLMCFSLFWHALDIVWVGVFTFVYLLGARG